ncbi:hypothetical protein N2152v2_010610 [Parachlorella kessleri]
MDSGGAVRRSTRAAARAALAKVHSISQGDEQKPPTEEAVGTAQQQESKQRKRRKVTTTSTEPESLLAGPVEHTAVAAHAEDIGAVAEAVLHSMKTSAAAKLVDRKRAAVGTAGPSREYEKELWQQGYANVAGIDEAGRGPLAGPVVAAACIVPPHVHIPGIDDSKKLNEGQREEVYAALTSHPDVRWAAQVIEAEEIDRINILQAALKAMEGAAVGLGEGAADFFLVDGNRLPKGFDPERSRPIVKGDSKCHAIAAASIIAKVTRDRLMEGYHQQYPVYSFGQHKGYCVPAHVEAIRKHGPCPIHRRTFAPVKNWFPLGEATE